MRRIGGMYEKDLPRENLETILQDAVMGVCIVEHILVFITAFTSELYNRTLFAGMGLTYFYV